MTGSKAVINALRRQILVESTAYRQFIMNRQVCAAWGYAKLAEHYQKEAEEEQGHLNRLLERWLFLEGDESGLGAGTGVGIFADVEEMLTHDLELENEAVRTYNESVDTARQEHDHGSSRLFESILADEEEAVNWLEAQLQIIQDVTLGRYLMEQVG